MTKAHECICNYVKLLLIFSCVKAPHFSCLTRLKLFRSAHYIPCFTKSAPRPTLYQTGNFLHAQSADPLICGTKLHFVSPRITHTDDPGISVQCLCGSNNRLSFRSRLETLSLRVPGSRQTTFFFLPRCSTTAARSCDIRRTPRAGSLLIRGEASPRKGFVLSGSSLKWITPREAWWSVRQEKVMCWCTKWGTWLRELCV